MATSIRVDVEKIERQGTNKHQRAYFIQSGYAHLPGLRFPQLIEFYTETVLIPGSYDVPCAFRVEDRKVAFALDYSAAKPAKVAA